MATLRYPWIVSRYNDRPELCSICGRDIGMDELRGWNIGTRKPGHLRCVEAVMGAREMGDRGNPLAPVEAETPMAKAHRENMEAGEKLRNVLAMMIVVLEQINATIEKKVGP